ncbi:MAG TPA: Dabb family protein [Polyangiaceae bacterium]|jgi:hypothetical protein|nr:Dabb family protein [Polyangiaceae bacterium]
MVRHILLLQPRPDATGEAIDACRRAITSLVGQIPGLVDCHWGQNRVAPDRREGFTHGFSMDFRDLESLDAYGPHPAHAGPKALIRATFDRIVVLDLEL